jgi:hypothetical protein
LTSYNLNPHCNQKFVTFSSQKESFFKIGSGTATDFYGLTDDFFMVMLFIYGVVVFENLE